MTPYSLPHMYSGTRSFPIPYISLDAIWRCIELIGAW